MLNHVDSAASICMVSFGWVIFVFTLLEYTYDLQRERSVVVDVVQGANLTRFFRN